MAAEQTNISNAKLNIVEESLDKASKNLDVARQVLKTFVQDSEAMERVMGHKANLVVELRFMCRPGGREGQVAEEGQKPR